MDINRLIVASDVGNPETKGEPSAPSVASTLLTNSSNVLEAERALGNSQEEPLGHLGTIAFGGMQTLKNLDRVFGTAESQANMEEMIQKQAPLRFNSFKEIDSVGSAVDYSFQQLELQAANLMGLVMAGGTGAAAGSATMGATAGLLPMHLGESLGKMDEAGVVDAKVSDAIIPATINTGMDVVGLRKIGALLGLGKHLGMKDKVTSAVASTFGKRVGAGAKDVAGATAVEMSTELAQENINGIWAQLMLDKSWRDALTDGLQSGDEALETLVATFASTAPLVTAGRIVAPPPQAGVTTEVPPVKVAEAPSVEAPPVEAPPTEVTEVEPKTEVPETEEPTHDPVPEETPATPPEDGMGDGQSTPPQTEAPETDEKVTVEMEQEEESILRVRAVTDVMEKTGTYTVEDMRAAMTEEEVNSEIGKLAEESVKMAEEIGVLDFKNVPQFMKSSMSSFIKSLANGFGVTNVAPVRQGVRSSSIWNGRLYETASGISPLDTILKTHSPGVYSSLAVDMVSGRTFAPEVQEEIVQMVELMRSQLTPDTTVFIQYGKEGANSSTAATHYGFGTARDKFSVITINADSTHFDKVADSVGGKLGGKKLKDAVHKVVAHEMAHALAAHEMRNLPVALRKKIIKEYLDLMGKIKDGMTYRDFLKARYASDNSQHRKTPSYILDSTVLELQSFNSFGIDYRYTFDFEEFFAEKIADEVVRADFMQESNIKGFFPRLLETLQNFIRTHFTPDEYPAVYRDVINHLTRYHRVLSEADRHAAQEISKTVLHELLGMSEKIDLPPTQFWHKTYDQLLESGNAGPAIFASPFKDVQPDFDKAYRVRTGFNKATAFFLSPRQLARRYNIKPAMAYMEEVRKFWSTKMAGIGRADEIARQWRNLSETEGDKLSAYLFELSETSDELGRRLSPSELKLLQESYKLSPEVIHLAGEIDKAFTEVLTRTRLASQIDVARAFVYSPKEFIDGYNKTTTPEEKMQYALHWVAEDQKLAAHLLTELGKIEKQYNALENKNYYPRMRFGDFAIIIKETDANGITRVIDFAAFETQGDMDKALKAQMVLTDKDPNIHIQGVKLDDVSKSLWGMPQLVIDRITDALKKSGELTQEQADILRAVSLDLSPGKRHMRTMQKRLNVAGYSRDGLRTFSSYMTNASNHLARIEHNAELLASLKELETMHKGIDGDVSDLNMAAEYYREHFKYIMNPENDLAWLRNLGFLWYLGFNVKSALVNLSQLPMVTYPWLAARFGDIDAVSALTRASKDTAQHTLGKKQFTAGEQALLNQLTKEGVIDESFAMELSALSNSNLITRLSKRKGLDRNLSQFNYAAGYLFSGMEKFNRRVNALAAYRLAVTKKKMPHAEAVRFARDSVMDTQFEYAKWDRAALMRGKKSVALLFMNYTQSFLYTAFNGNKDVEGRRTALRMWVTLGLIAGLQGLPGAEYFLTILDSLGTTLYRVMGWQNPKVDSRKAIREYLAQVTNREAADLFLHGTSRYGFGAGLLAEQVFGSPMSVDLSGSLSMGAPLQFGRTTTREGYQMKDFLLEATGALGGAVNGVWEASTSTDPDTWKRVEKALPVAMRNLSKGLRYEVRGEETFKGGAQFMNVSDQTALNIMQMMGFSGTDINQRRELFGEQMQAALYWNARRKHYLDEYALAKEWGDKEKQKDIIEEIADFNKSLTEPSLRPFRISSKDRMASIKQRRSTNRKKERGDATKDRERKLFKELEKIYPDY